MAVVQPAETRFAARSYDGGSAARLSREPRPDSCFFFHWTRSTHLGQVDDEQVQAEFLGDGRDPWPEVQKEAIEKVAAAICRHHGWSERSVIGHKEWQPGKVDPRGFTMGGMRKRIGERLDGKGGSTKPKPADPKPAPKPKYEPFPGSAFFHIGQKSPIITAMGRRLVAEGCSRYEEGPSPEWTEADRRSYTAWQHKLGFKGKDADGIPGKVSWDKLRVPNT